MIQTAEHLAALVARVLAAPSVALDTEFVWERTFYPRLGVIQAGLPSGECFLIDACAGIDLAPLGAVLASPQVEKILHDAQQDLTILSRVTGQLPRRVFDTRTAAGFAGCVATISLQELLATMRSVALSKTETRTNWLRRPLSDKQVAYALDDVKHMHALRDEVRRRVDAFGHLSWLDEELAAYDDPSLYMERDPRAAYERVKGAGLLHGRKLAVLRELAAWRELEARRRDLPREHVTSDSALIATARHSPQTPEALASAGTLSPGTIHHAGDAVAAAVAAGLAVPREQWPRFGPSHRRHNVKELVDEALAVVRENAAREHVDPGLVTTRAELTSLAHAGGRASPEQYRVLRGWRHALVGEKLLALVSGGAHAAPPSHQRPA